MSSYVALAAENTVSVISPCGRCVTLGLYMCVIMPKRAHVQRIWNKLKLISRIRWTRGYCFCCLLSTVSTAVCLAQTGVCLNAGWTDGNDPFSAAHCSRCSRPLGFMWTWRTNKLPQSHSQIMLKSPEIFAGIFRKVSLVLHWSRFPLLNQWFKCGVMFYCAGCFLEWH